MAKSNAANTFNFIVSLLIIRINEEPQDSLNRPLWLGNKQKSSVDYHRASFAAYALHSG
ncbi:hypothetical protein GCM10009410_31160 [Shewanella ulleungensis]|jgi:hypothetical protein|uniref:Uncharacterized protein n=1 Tax=Shewanella ulleungensis TaxID=2282699 RepID=A0ABQ2QV31_9GAMM|nr:hypothetical protein GCM10009410_31160 [Shewanella ulleungensis]